MEEYTNLIKSWNELEKFIKKPERGTSYYLTYNNFSNHLLQLSKKIEMLEDDSKKYQKFKEHQGKGKRKSKKMMQYISIIRAYNELGVSNAEIARRLEISEGTVRNYLKEINRI